MKKGISILLVSIAATCLYLTTAPIYAEDLISHPEVINQQNCFSGVFASYQTWRDKMYEKMASRNLPESELKNKQASFDNIFGEQKFQHFKEGLECRTFQYKVDEHFVHGFVIQPKVTTKKLPVIIYNRGGNGNYGAMVFGAMMSRLFPLAEEGFVVVGSQYRGTFTPEHLTLDEFGGSDVNDVVELANMIEHVKHADAERIGMFGGSRGGMQTYLAVKRLPQIKAIAISAGVTDLARGLTIRPEMERVYENRIPNFKENKEKELAKRSVINWVDTLSKHVPILLIHGEEDKRVSVTQSIVFAQALEQHKIPHKLIVYKDEGHVLRKNKQNLHDEVVDWFSTYL